MQAADQSERTPSIYRCPAAEGEFKFFASLVEEMGFDTYCVEPKPGARAKEAAKGKVKFISSKEIDTPANLKWRNATIEFVNGKISPKAWLAKTAGLHETVHFLSSPKTPDLRTATGTESYRAVFAEMLLLSWPGKPCITANDTGQTRYLPGPGRLESWYLSMRDYLGPMLYYRHSAPFMVTGKPTILRADAKPGLLIFRQSMGKKSLTMYLNNSDHPVSLPPIDLDHVTSNIGLNINDEKRLLMQKGFFIVDLGKE